MKNIILICLLLLCACLVSCVNPTTGEREVKGLSTSEWGGVLSMAGKALLPGFIGSYIDRVNNDAEAVRQKKEASLPPATPAASK